MGEGGCGVGEKIFKGGSCVFCMFDRKYVLSGLAALVLCVGCDRAAEPSDAVSDPVSEVPVVEATQGEESGSGSASNPRQNEYARMSEYVGSNYSLSPPTPYWISVRVDAHDGIVERVMFNVPDPAQLADVAGHVPVMYEVPAVQRIRSLTPLPTDTPPYTATLTIADPSKLDEQVLRVIGVSQDCEVVLYEGCFHLRTD